MMEQLQSFIRNQSPELLRAIEEATQNELPPIIHDLDEKLSHAMRITQLRGEVEQSLEEVEVTEEMSRSEPECPVCYEKFKKGEKAVTRPCEHLQHEACVRAGRAKHKFFCPYTCDDPTKRV